MRTEFIVKIKADFTMTEYELRNKFKHWIEHNIHTTSSFGFEIEELSKPTLVKDRL